MRPNWVTGTFPRSCSAGVAFRWYTFFQSVYNLRGTPCFSIQGSQDARSRPDRLFFPQTSHGFVGGVIHHVHQAATGTTIFQPIMETAVQLHQFPEVRFAFPSLAVFLALPLPAPQPFLPHPKSQGFVIQHDAVFFGQVLGRQRRPESRLLRTGIFFSNQMQNSAAQF